MDIHRELVKLIKIRFITGNKKQRKSEGEREGDYASLKVQKI